MCGVRVCSVQRVPLKFKIKTSCWSSFYSWTLTLNGCEKVCKSHNHWNIHSNIYLKRGRRQMLIKNLNFFFLCWHCHWHYTSHTFGFHTYLRANERGIKHNVTSAFFIFISIKCSFRLFIFCVSSLRVFGFPWTIRWECTNILFMNYRLIESMVVRSV